MRPYRFRLLRAGRALAVSILCSSTIAMAQGGSIADSRWSLAESSFEPSELKGRVRPPSLQFSGDRLSANSGCNVANGAFKVESGRLQVGPMASTRRACPSPIAEFENRLFALLTANPTIAIDGDVLTLAAGDDSVRFARVAVPGKDAVVKFIEVGPELVDCVGVAPMKCLQVRDGPNDPWRVHYGGIAGFEHQPGIAYRLRILEERVPNPPADASSLRWTLDLVVEQRVVEK